MYVLDGQVFLCIRACVYVCTYVCPCVLPEQSSADQAASDLVCKSHMSTPQ